MTLDTDLCVCVSCLCILIFERGNQNILLFTNKQEYLPERQRLPPFIWFLKKKMKGMKIKNSKKERKKMKEVRGNS